MPDNKFLTSEEVAERYRGGVSTGTLRNWRAMRIGPTFAKIGKAVLCPTDQLDAWDEKYVDMPCVKATRDDRRWDGVTITLEHERPLPITAPYVVRDSKYSLSIQLGR